MSSLPISFDKYAAYARLVPALVVLLPLGVSMACLFPQKFEGWDLLVWFSTVSGIGFLLEQLARDQGIIKEPKLFKRWGGKPTVLYLRHKGSPLGKVTAQRYHKRLSLLIDGITMPTEEEEECNQERTDDVYDSCIAFLRAQTRDKIKYSLLFAENVNYGFRRNLWGMKVFGMVSTLLSITIILLLIHPNWLIVLKTKPVVIIALILDVSFLLLWIFRINPDWVRIAADAYSKQLLTACDQMDTGRDRTG